MPCVEARERVPALLHPSVGCSRTAPDLSSSSRTHLPGPSRLAAGRLKEEGVEDEIHGVSGLYPAGSRGSGLFLLPSPFYSS